MTPDDEYETKVTAFGMRAPLPQDEPTRSQRLSAAGYTRRPTWKSLPSDDAPLPQDERALHAALRIAEAALADIGDADREPGDDLAWCERRAAEALPAVRAALSASPAAPIQPMNTDEGHSASSPRTPFQAVRTSGDGEELKRYDFDWTYVGIESKQNEYGEWVRYVDALAFYSKELDRVHAEGRAVSLAKPFWTVFNGDGAVIGDDMTLEGVRECLTPARCARGWNAVYTFVVTKPEDLPNE